MFIVSMMFFLIPFSRISIFLSACHSYSPSINLMTFRFLQDRWFNCYVLLTGSTKTTCLFFFWFELSWNGKYTSDEILLPHWYFRL